MLIVKVHNISPKEENEFCDYNCEVLVTVTPTQLKTIALGKVKKHRRGNGWRELLKRASEELKDV